MSNYQEEVKKQQEADEKAYQYISIVNKDADYCMDNFTGDPNTPYMVAIASTPAPDGMGYLTAYQHLSFVEVGGVAYHLDVGRGIAHTDKLATQLRMRVIDHHNGHIANDLVIIYPRIEQWIDQGHNKEEDDDTFVFEYLTHLVAPDNSSITDTVKYCA